MYLPSGTRLGPYKIESPIGAGGMGEVYRATDTRLNRNVAVKILSSRLTAEPSAKQRLNTFCEFDILNNPRSIQSSLPAALRCLQIFPREYSPRFVPPPPCPAPQSG